MLAANLYQEVFVRDDDEWIQWRGGDRQGSTHRALRDAQKSNNKDRNANRAERKICYFYGFIVWLRVPQLYTVGHGKKPQQMQNYKVNMYVDCYKTHWYTENKYSCG